MHIGNCKVNYKTFIRVEWGWCSCVVGFLFQHSRVKKAINHGSYGRYFGGIIWGFMFKGIHFCLLLIERKELVKMDLRQSGLCCR